MVEYCDPFFPSTPVTRKRALKMTPVACENAAWRRYDAVVVSTAHEIFKNTDLFQGMQLVVDTRSLVGALFPGGGGPRRLVKA